MTTRAKQLKALLAARGYDFTLLALHAGVGRCQLSQVINETRQGDETRRRVANLLEHRELELLGWPPSEPEYSI